MKNRSLIKEYVVFFFTVLGIVLTVYLGYTILSPFITTLNFSSLHFISLYIIAVLLTASKLILCSDKLTLKINNKVRVIMGLVPAAAAVLMISYYIGLQNLFFNSFQDMSAGKATLIFTVLLIVTFLLLLSVWAIIAKKMQKLAADYNEALNRYKDKHYQIER